MHRKALRVNSHAESSPHNEQPSIPTRSQAAMEYLMTYGWTILIIAIVISGLYSYGLFTLGRGGSFTGCLAVSGFTCTEPILVSSGVLTAGVGIFGQMIMITGAGCSANSTAPSTWVSTNIILSSGQTSLLSFKCPTGSPGSVFKGTLWVTYNTITSSPPGGGVIQEVGQVSIYVPFFGPAGGGNCSAQPSTYSNGIGNPYSVTVPPNCGNVTLSLYGGGGGSGEEGAGGNGGFISGNYVVIPGQTFYVWVGSGNSNLAAGTPGGGSSPPGSGGGGCSVVSSASTSPSNPYVIIVAAGGGGGASSSSDAGGSGGGTSGQGGFAGGGPGGGGGGTQSGPGGAGGSGATSGTSYDGGSSALGGGGGCGYYGGGGGGNSAGGGGGSSWSSSAVTNVINTLGGGGYGGQQGSDGYSGKVTLTWYN
jgi:hypothetical protein